MSERSRLRLVVLRVLVVSLLVTLFGRLWYLQVIAGDTYARAAQDNQLREIVDPATRGQILDDVGRPLVRNRTAMVVSVDRIALLRQRDRGAVMLARLSPLLGMPLPELRQRVTLCPHAPRPLCWNGSPYQPIPVTDRAGTAAALAILERREQFPGVTAELTAVRDFPKPAGANAAHLLGYLSPVTDAELAARKAGKGQALLRTDLVGRAGLEAEYDAALRGVPGVRRVAVDSVGAVTRELGDRPPVPGDHLVTSLDGGVQRVVEDALVHAVERAHSLGDRDGTPLRGTAAAGVVLDVRTGRVVALASYPTYDPAVWVGGISVKHYRALTAQDAGIPLLSRAVQGEFAPASTFKVISTAAAVQAGYPLDGVYACPGSYSVGSRLFRNFDSQPLGPVTLHTALVKSCDTVFYRFAYEMWLHDGGTSPGPAPADPMVTMAKAWGLGRKTGIDLPSESSGRIADRAWKKRYWAAMKKSVCADATREPPGSYARQVAVEFCADGWRFRAGDAANFAIGQGDTLVTPLQLATAYAALANGGTVWSPRIGKAVLSPNGRVVERIEPRVRGRLPVPPPVLAYIREALAGVPVSGTAAGAFAGFPLDRLPVAGKTGTGQVLGKQDTSWFVSFAPANAPQFAVVVMVAEGGQGARVAAPAVREIYEGMYGLAGRPAALPGGQPPTGLPVVRNNVVVPASSPPTSAGDGRRSG